MKLVMKNTMQIKEHNREYIRKQIKSNPNSTKLDIAKLTGLSVATCGSILNEMLESGEVITIGQMHSNGGRPATQYTYNVKYSYVICIYLGYESGVGTMSYAVVNMVGEAVEQDWQVVPHIDFELIVDSINKLKNKYEKVLSVGIGVPGEVQDGYIDYCDIVSLRDFHLKEKLQEHFNLNIFVGNDMDFITYGFYKKRDIDKKNNIAVVYFSKDNFPGAGVIVEGNILRGYTMFAGELTYLAIGFGISREEQQRQFDNPETFPKMASRFVIPIISIINPKTIALMGNLINDQNIEVIKRYCRDVIPEKHIPEIIVDASVHENYMNGLIELTLENTNV